MPEITENKIRIPVNDCKITATINLGEKDGISALYCGDTKQIATYLFSTDKWDMARARKWVSEHSKAMSKAVEEEIKAELGKETEKQRVEKSYIVPIIKIDEEKRLVYGIVLEPNTVDAQKDYESEAEIEKACHTFMRESQKVYTNHKDIQKEVVVVENYIAPEDFKLNKESVKKGSWVMVTHCANDEVWEQVKKGEFTGYSIRGFANRQ